MSFDLNAFTFGKSNTVTVVDKVEELLQVVSVI
jgi:hypothetical protein